MEQEKYHTKEDLAKDVGISLELALKRIKNMNKDEITAHYKSHKTFSPAEYKYYKELLLNNFDMGGVNSIYVYN